MCGPLWPTVTPIFCPFAPACFQAWLHAVADLQSHQGSHARRANPVPQPHVLAISVLDTEAGYPGPGLVASLRRWGGSARWYSLRHWGGSVRWRPRIYRHFGFLEPPRGAVANSQPQNGRCNNQATIFLQPFPHQQSRRKLSRPRDRRKRRDPKNRLWGFHYDTKSFRQTDRQAGRQTDRQTRDKPVRASPFTSLKFKVSRIDSNFYTDLGTFIPSKLCSSKGVWDSFLAIS